MKRTARLALALGATTTLVEVSGCDRSRGVANADGAHGKRLFASICARCHGIDGRGGLAAIDGVKPRNFCDHEFHKSRTDDDLERVILLGKDNRMPSFAGVIAPTDIKAIVRYLRSFDPAPE